MYGIAFYLISISALYTYALLNTLYCIDASDFEAYKVGIVSTIIGGLGGCMYCLRGLYVNCCARGSWDKKWVIWYILRPITSAGSGAVSFLFLKAGLLVLESNVSSSASEFGFYALAFIAGLNVDKFMKKIEDIGEAVFGIEKSRATGSTPTKGGED